MSISKLIRTTTFLIFFSIGSSLMAQEKIEITESDYQNQEVAMADTMRSNGKIYVVVAVIITIFAGLATYTVFIDRKIKKLEQKEN